MRRAVVLLIFVFAGCNKPAGVTIDKDGKQHVAIRADDKGFTPSSVALKKGAPSTLTFTRTSDDTCATEVVFPELNVKKTLPLNQPVDVDVPTGDARTLGFTCGMGMFKSAVVIQ
jgi:plastocyanin domain-containing protein